MGAQMNDGSMFFFGTYEFFFFFDDPSTSLNPFSVKEIILDSVSVISCFFFVIIHFATPWDN